MSRFNRMKACAFALFISLVIGFAFFTPLTLQGGVIDRITPLARLICPETGKFAPRYWQSRRASGPHTWEACLDSQGKRIEDRTMHLMLVNGLGFFWTALLFIPLFWVGRQLFRPRRYVPG
ncbi:hypothetical protein [Terrarubrum flagellatum]|uniref:hypothetical protein n=1 Tax=Terrirubrum flagellatum TaxID=2895980 RepID=UPI00314520EE